MSTTQDGRLLKVTTPLADDFLLIKRIRATEGISQLFRYELELLHEEDEVSDEPTLVDPQQILGQKMTVSASQADGAERFFNGICVDFTQGNRNERFSKYRAEIVPQIWLLTQNSQSRIFQNQSVPEILRKVFEGFEFDDEIQGRFEPRNYCVQYRESDFNFASRLMEEEGIFYYFEHTADSHRMILANTPGSHRECPTKSEIPFETDISADPDEWAGAIRSWQVSNKLRAGKFTLRDFNFQLPTNNLETVQMSRFSIGGNQQLEIYDYPGHYANRFDGIDAGGGAQPSVLQKVFDDRTRTVAIRQQEIDVAYKGGPGTSDCCALTAGYRFKLTEHPEASNNRNHLLVSLRIESTQSPSYISEEDVQNSYGVSFASIPHGDGQAPFAPVRRAVKPTVSGSQTAVVVGPAGEEIFTDKFGRVKVQFHWDREGRNDASSSCWLRVSTSIAGNKWGTMFIPRVGQEVIVDFLEGDPDQPIITGSVYNAATMPHYELPKFKTLTYIKTRTSPDDGKGFNELRFEDKAGKEQVFVRSQKRYDLRARGSMYETCGGNRQEVIGVRSDNQPGGNLAVTVGGNHDLHVKADQFIGVDGKLNEGITGNVVEGYDGTQQTVVKGKVELNAREIVMEALTAITMKVGGSFVKVDLTGITIQGPFTKINSGGAAAGTGPATLDSPLDAETADTGEPGYLDRPRTGGGGRGRRSRTLNGQHAPENIVRNPNGTYQMGNIVVQGNEAYQQAVLSDLATMGTTPAGQNMLNQLQSTGQTTTIRPLVPAANPANAFAQPGTGTFADYQNATPAGQPVFDGGGNPLNDSSGNQLLGTGTGGPSDVQYNPGDWPSPTSASQAPGDVILFHELNHSIHQENGTYDGTPRTDGFDTNEEFNSIGPENQYRDERGVPRRTDHHDL